MHQVKRKHVIPFETAASKSNGPEGINAQFHELEKVLGRIPDIVKYDHAYHQSRAYSDLTELLMKRLPKVVPDRITGLLRDNYYSVLVHEILPIHMLLPHEGLRVQWSTFHLEAGFVPQVSDEGVAPIYTHTSSKHSAVAVRRAAGIRIEAEFYQTEEGRREWALKIEQLASLIQRTNEYDIMLALLESPLQQQIKAENNNGPYNVYGAGKTNMSFMDRLRMEVEYYGIVNKTPDSRGLNNMITSVRQAMARSSVAPDYMIVPGGLIGFFYQDKDDLWQYSSAGPQALKNRENAADIADSGPIRMQSIQGLKIVDMNIYRATTAASTHEAVDLLTVPRMIGEFYASEIDAVCSDLTDFETSFRSRDRNISIFNEQHGVFTKVSYSDMLRNCHRWEDNVSGFLDREQHYGVQDDMFIGPTGEVITNWVDMRPKYLSTRILERIARTLGNLCGRGALDQLSSIMERYVDLCVGNPLIRDEAGVGYVEGDDNYEEVKSELMRRHGSALLRAAQKIISSFKNVSSEYIQQLFVPLDNGSLHRFVVSMVGEEWSTHFDREDPLYEEQLDHIGVSLQGMGLFHRFMTTIWLKSPVNLETLVDQHEKDIFVPIDFLLCRPYMTFSTSSAIICKGGEETGSLLVGRTSFACSESTNDRMIGGNVVYYSRAFVREQDNVCVCPSVFINSYIKGADTSFITRQDLDEISDDAGLLTSKNSILCMAVPVGENVSRHTTIDIRGRHEYLQNEIETDRNMPFYSTAQYYKRLLDIEGTDLASPLNPYQDYRTSSYSPNSICFRGAYEYGPNMSKRTTNTGHLGPNTYNGVHMSRKPNTYVPVRQMPNMTVF